MADSPLKKDLARTFDEARIVMTYMRAVANKESSCVLDSQRAIRESLALLKRMPDRL